MASRFACLTASLAMVALPGSAQAPAVDVAVQENTCTPHPRPDNAAMLGKLPDRPYFPLDWASQGYRCDNACQTRMTPFVMGWYSRQLGAAKEPSLHALAARSEPGTARQVRFTWLRSFDHTVIVRIVFETDGYRLIAKELSGTGGHDPGSVARSVDRKLNAREQRQVNALFARSVFTPDPDRCMINLDGAQWLLESVQQGQYQFAERFTPRDGNLRAAGMAMLAFTGWTFKRIY